MNIQTQEARFEQFETEELNFTNPNEVNREANRFIWFGGDIISPAQKRESALMRRGGEYLGQDYKTLRLTKGALWQCEITPMVKAYDFINEDLDPDGNLASDGFVHTESGKTVGALALKKAIVYPGDEIKGLIRPGGNQKGIVELTALQGLEPKDRDTFQEFYFENWQNIKLGIEELPAKISVKRALIAEGLTRTSDEDIRLTGEQMLSSLDQYYDWGIGYLKVFSQLVKTPINQGHVHTYGAIAEMLFAQLEVKREDLLTKEQEVADILAKVNTGGTVNSDDMKAMLKTLTDNQAMFQQFLMSQAGVTPPVVEVEPKLRCSELTSKNEPCKGFPMENGKCSFHNK